MISLARGSNFIKLYGIIAFWGLVFVVDICLAILQGFN